MDPRDFEILRENYLRLVTTLETPNLLNYLYQERVLSEYDKEAIMAKKTSIRRNETLLDKLTKRENGLKKLVQALLESKVQGFLGNELLEKVSWSKDEMKQFRLELKGKLGHQQMMEAEMTALKQDFRQLEVKCDGNQNTINKLTHDSHMLKVSNAVLKAKMLVLKQENNQLKVKIDQSQNMLKEVTDKLEMLETKLAVLKEENDQLKGENDKQNTIKDVFAPNFEEKDEKINQELGKRDLTADQQKVAAKQEALQLQSFTGITQTLHELEEKVRENDEILKSLKEDQAQKKKEKLKQLESAVTDVMENQETLKDQGKKRRRDKPSRLREIPDKSGRMRMEVHRLGFLA